MKGTIVVCGHGPGISDAVAQRFGREGHPVALVARNGERLAAAARALGHDGINAKSFVCDLANPEAVRRLIADVRDGLGPISVVHYNAYPAVGGDLTTATAADLHSVFDVSVVGLVTAVQAALPDLKAHGGSVLVTGGGLSAYDARVDSMAVQWGMMGLAVGKAAQHKTVGLLHQKLVPEGIYVGEVVVLGLVKGTAFDSGQATLEPSDIAERFWQLHEARSPASVNFG